MGLWGVGQKSGVECVSAESASILGELALDAGMARCVLWVRRWRLWKLLLGCDCPREWPSDWPWPWPWPWAEGVGPEMEAEGATRGGWCRGNSGAEASRSLNWRCIWMVSGTLACCIMLCCHICTWSVGVWPGVGTCCCMAQFGI